MRQAITYLSLLFYLLYCNGVSLYVHYCGAEVASVSLYVETVGCVCEDGYGEEDNDCCEDKSKSVRNGDSHSQSPKTLIQIPIVEAEVFSASCFYQGLSSEANFYPTPYIHAPPEDKPLYLLHGVFII